LADGNISIVADTSQGEFDSIGLDAFLRCDAAQISISSPRRSRYEQQGLPGDRCIGLKAL